MLLFRADTGNNRKIAKNCQRLQKFLSNSYAFFQLENLNFLSNPNVNPKIGVAYKKTCKIQHPLILKSNIDHSSK